MQSCFTSCLCQITKAFPKNMRFGEIQIMYRPRCLQNTLNPPSILP